MTITVCLVPFCFAQSQRADPAYFEVTSLSKKFDVRIQVERVDGELRGRGIFSIFHKGASKPFQTIRLRETAISVEENEKPLFTTIADKRNGKWSSLYLDDLNFDATEDLAIPDGMNGGYGGISYRIYLFDRKRGRFLFSSSFTRLSQGPFFGVPEVDGKRKTLETFWKSGAGFRAVERYRIQNNRPRKIYVLEDSLLPDGKRYITTKKLINGKWRVWEKTVKDIN